MQKSTRTLPRPSGVVLLLAGVLVAGCGTVLDPAVVGSGTIETIEPGVAEVRALVVDSAFDVTVAAGSGYDLVVRADDNIVDRVRADVDGGTLTIRLDGPVGPSTLEADLTVPDDALETITASGASQVATTDPLTAAGIELAASGASTLDLDLDTDTVSVDASGASTVRLTGSAGTLDALASGASTLRLADLPVSTAVVEAQGASTIEVTVEDSLTATASGASTVRYAGSPSAVASDSSGASTIQQQ